MKQRHQLLISFVCAAMLLYFAELLRPSAPTEWPFATKSFVVFLTTCLFFGVFQLHAECGRNFWYPLIAYLLLLYAAGPFFIFALHWFCLAFG